MGSYLSSPKTEKVSEDGENSRLRYGLSSMQGWRTTMEDAHAAFCNLDDSTSFFGVYDGHGGADVSKSCAEFLHQQVMQHEAYAAGDVETSVKKAFLRMDEMIREETGQEELVLPSDKMDQSSGEGQYLPQEGTQSVYRGPTCGSTACVAIIQNNQLIVANAGDSRCVISRKGKAHDLSKDHKPDLAAEKQRILDAGGFVRYGRVNGTLNLARAIGDIELKQNKSLPAEKQIVTADPDVVTVVLSEDDEFLIIACDGIWDCMTSQRAVDCVNELLATENTLSRVCERVLDECLAPETGQEGCDNMTMILVQFKKPSDPKESSSEHESSANTKSDLNS